MLNIIVTMEIQIKTTTKPTAYPFRMAEIIIKNLTIPRVARISNNSSSDTNSGNLNEFNCFGKI